MHVLLDEGWQVLWDHLLLGHSHGWHAWLSGWHLHDWSGHGLTHGGGHTLWLGHVGDAWLLLLLVGTSWLSGTTSVESTWTLSVWALLSLHVHDELLDEGEDLRSVDHVE